MGYGDVEYPRALGEIGFVKLSDLHKVTNLVSERFNMCFFSPPSLRLPFAVLVPLLFINQTALVMHQPVRI